MNESMTHTTTATTTFLPQGDLEPLKWLGKKSERYMGSKTQNCHIHLHLAWKSVKSMNESGSDPLDQMASLTVRVA